MASSQAASRSRDRKQGDNSDSTERKSAETGTRTKKRTRLWFVLGGVAIICIMIAVFGPRSIRSYAVYQVEQKLITRDYESAREWLDWGSRAAPEDGELEFYSARVYRKLGDFAEFEKSLGRARQYGYSAERIRRERWLMEAQSGKMSEAEGKLIDLLDDEFGDSAEVAEAFVSGYILTGRFSQATLFLEQWAEDYPEDPQPHFMYGLMYKHSGRTSEAEEAFRKALEIDPTHMTATLSLGDLLAEQRRFDEAIPLFEKVVESPRHQLDGLSRLGTCLRRSGELERAREVLGEALEIDANHVPSLVSLGQTEVQLDQYELAIEHLEKALPEIKPDPSMVTAYATALRGVGRVEEANERAQYAQEASEALSKADDLSRTLTGDKNPEEVATRAEIGRIVLKYSSEQDGLIWLYSAIDLQPNYLPAHVMLAEYFEENSARNPIFADRATLHRAVIENLTGSTTQVP